MRGSRTLDMLKELHAEKWVTGEAVKDLTDAYCFLRTVEHRLQMVADEQTQRLPFERADLSRFARFCGYARLESFARDLTFHLTRVEAHYARLFEDAPTLSVASGSLVFTGVARRSRDARDASPPRLPASGGGGRDDPRLALRPRGRRCAARAPARC